jgi:hypothetical protein
MGPIAGPDAVGKRKILCPCRDSNHGCPDRCSITILTELAGYQEKQVSTATSLKATLSSRRFILVSHWHLPSLSFCSVSIDRRPV